MMATPTAHATLVQQARERTPTMVTQTLPASNGRLSGTPDEFNAGTPTSCIVVHPARS
jgi:hypothetical protein